MSHARLSSCCWCIFVTWPLQLFLLMSSETQAGVRTLTPSDLAQEVSPHSKEVLRQEVRTFLPLTRGRAQVPLTRKTYFDLKLVSV